MTFGSLIVRHGHGAFETRQLDRATFSIGAAADNDLVLGDASAAPYHIQIVSDERGSQVLVLDNLAATSLDGARLAQGAQPLRGGAILKVGATTIVVDLRPAAPTVPIQPPHLPPLAVAPSAGLAPEPHRDTPPPPQPGRGDIDIRLSADTLQVEAGKTMSARVAVRNRSSIVDQVDLAVEGVPSSWVRLLPARHNLDTTGRGASGESEVIFSPPRAPQSEARTYPVNIVATSRVDPAARSSAPLGLTILPYSAYSLAIDPARRTATLEGGFDVRVSNGGNRLEQYRVVADDDADQVGFRFAPAILRVPPGETRSLRLRARAQKIKLVGAPVSHEFTVSVEPVNGGAELQAVRGTFAQRPPFSTWLVAAFAGMLLLSCLGLAGWLALRPIRAYLATRDATATAVAVQTAEASAAAARTSEAATIVAEQRTAAAQLTQVSQSRDATLTAIALRQAEREAAANNDVERAAIAEVAAAERRDAQGTAGAMVASISTMQAAAGAQRQTAERLAFYQSQTITTLAATGPSATPIITLTETAIALPFVLSGTIAAERTQFALEQERRVATEAAYAKTIEALNQPPPATERTISFATLNGQEVRAHTPLEGYEYEVVQDRPGMIICFFAASVGAYPLPQQQRGQPAPAVELPTAAPEPPTAAPELPTAAPELPTAAPELPTAAPEPEPGAPEDPPAEASPVTSGGPPPLFAARLAQADGPCLPQFTPAIGELNAQLWPAAATQNYKPALYPAVEGLNSPVLTADMGPPNSFIRSAVAILVFRHPVSRASLDFWHPPNQVAGYRIYALDVTGAVIDSDQTSNLGLASNQRLSVEQGTAGQQIAGVVLIGLDTSLAGNLRDDVLRASQPIFLQSVTIPNT